MENSYEIDLDSKLNSTDDLDRILAHVVSCGGSDLYMTAGRHLWMKLHSKMKRISARRVQANEVISMFASFYGDNAQAKLGAGEPIDASYEFRSGRGTESEQRFRFRVNAVGTQVDGKPSYAITFRPIPTTPPTAESIGIPSAIMECAKTTSQGLILVVGATGNGKSTALAAINRTLLEDADSNISLNTVEKPIEFVYDEIESPSSLVRQMEVGTHISSFRIGIENSLRMGPTHILVGEMKDRETIEAGLEGSMTGHALLSTLHANTVAETLSRMVSVYPDAMQPQARFDIVQSVRMVVAQRLIPSADGKRMPIREYLVFDQQIRERILNSANFTSSIFDAVRNAGNPMSDDVERAFRQERITRSVYEQQMANYEYAATQR